MKKEKTLSVIRILMISALFIIAGRVGATPYAFSVDQILLLGNLPGFAEDEFDNGVIAPWVVGYPTAIESGGVVTFSNPGDTDSEQIGNYIITQEESRIRLLDNLGVEDGGGDFVIISKWLPVVPEQNQLYGMRTHLDTFTDENLASINIGIFNIGPLFADIFDVPAGLMIYLQEDIAGIDEEVTQVYSIAAEDVTDSILFTTYFDDSTDLFTGGFSLDGGVTFQRPFEPISIPMSEAVFDGWDLNAIAYDVQGVPEPSTYLLMITGLAGLGFARRRWIKI